MFKYIKDLNLSDTEVALVRLDTGKVISVGKVNDKGGVESPNLSYEIKCPIELIRRIDLKQ